MSVEGVASFLIELRPLALPNPSTPSFAFGAPDAHGMVGESVRVWQLRAELAQVGATRAHVLLLGESGVGKELAARAISNGLDERQRPFVSRNAATIPSGLVEAELFGHASNYPNAGMKARQGLVGAAHGGDLFLDEIAELSHAQQANLLRVLDAGEYQRLGEDFARQSHFRLIAATNRSQDDLKHDLLARFVERVTIPGLEDRRADIALIAKHLLAIHLPTRTMSQSLTEALTRHDYQTHVRELEFLLRLSARESQDPTLELGPHLEQHLERASEPVELTDDAIGQALQRASSVNEAAKLLGLPSRYALYRIMKKRGIPAK